MTHVSSAGPDTNGCLVCPPCLSGQRAKGGDGRAPPAPQRPTDSGRHSTATRSPSPLPSRAEWRVSAFSRVALDRVSSVTPSEPGPCQGAGPPRRRLHGLGDQGGVPAQGSRGGARRRSPVAARRGPRRRARNGCRRRHCLRSVKLRLNDLGPLAPPRSEVPEAAGDDFSFAGAARRRCTASCSGVPSRRLPRRGGRRRGAGAG